jgi:hypothetical protein
MNASERDILHALLTRLQRTHRLLQTGWTLDAPASETSVQVELLLEEALSDVRKVLGIKKWPEPTVEWPDWETLEAWLWDDGGCEATDGCWVEPDGVCPHGHPAWFLRLGLI